LFHWKKEARDIKLWGAPDKTETQNLDSPEHSSRCGFISMSHIEQ
jgi:hypothetical protein